MIGLVYIINPIQLVFIPPIQPIPNTQEQFDPLAGIPPGCFALFPVVSLRKGTTKVQVENLSYGCRTTLIALSTAAPSFGVRAIVRLSVTRTFFKS